MIVDEKLVISWNGRNKKYYENLGYKYTKQNDKFTINTCDLNPSSHIKIRVKCNNCSVINSVAYRDYLKKKYDNYYCSICANQLYGINTRRKQSLKQSESFLKHNTNKLGDDFYLKYWSRKNTVDPDEVSYGSSIKVWIKCTEESYHDDYLVSCCGFSTGRRCPMCAGKQVHPKDSIAGYIQSKYGFKAFEDLWSKKNTCSPYSISDTNGDKVWWKCKLGLHTDFLKRVSDMKYNGFQCPECSYARTVSMLQEKVANYILNNYSYTLRHEQDCSLSPVNPKTKSKMRYDNEVVELGLIIEVHGSQHYIESGFNMHRKDPEDSIAYHSDLLFRDKYKKDYALSHGYFYLEIPYWTENDESYKQLIDDKIEEIKIEMRLN